MSLTPEPNKDNKDYQRLFEKIFEVNKEKVYCFAFKLTKDSERANEIMQQCFVQLWEKIHTLHEDQDAFPLLYVYTKNIVVDEVRKQYRRKKAMAHLLQTQPSSQQDESKLHHKEYKQILQKTLEKMPDERRRIYFLSKEHGLTHKEIASQLAISTYTVRNQLGMAARFIRQELQHYGISMNILYFITYLLLPVFY